MGSEFIRKPASHDRDVNARRMITGSREELRNGELDAVGDAFLSAVGTSEAQLGSALLKAGGASQARIAARLQHTRGNAFVQRLMAGSGGITQDYDELAPRIEAATAGGSGLDPDARARLEASLSADLAGVRVHTDAEADRLARAFDAVAFTTGQDIFFRAGEHNPRSPEGLRLLAHEAAHALQQGPGQSRPGQGSLELSQPADTSEREAETIAGQVVAGQKASVSAAPGAPIARGVWDSVTGAASTAWDWTQGAAANTYAGMQQNAGYVRQGEQWAEHGIDWLEGQASGGAHWLANQAEGIPVLEQVANAGSSAVDQYAQFQGGILKGATGLLGGVAGAVANPVDTAIGLERLAEHTGTPGILNPFKMARGVYDVAVNGQDIGEVANRVLNPLESAKEDAAFLGNMGRGLIRPYEESIEKGKWSEAGGRAAFDIVSLLATGGGGAAAEGAAGAGRLTRLAGEAGEITRGLEGADLASQAVRGLEGSGAASEAVRGLEGAEAASQTVRTLEGAEAAQATGGVEAASEATRTLEMAEARQGGQVTAGASQDVGLASRGYRPAPGERSMSRAEWQAQYQRERAERSLAEAGGAYEAPMTEVATTDERMQKLAEVAESGDVRGIATDPQLYEAWEKAGQTGRSTATGRQAFDLQRGRMETQLGKKGLSLEGPIHHWRYPIKQYAGEATSAENLYATRAGETLPTAHTELHRAIGVEGRPFAEMAWGQERGIQSMFDFWNSDVRLEDVWDLLGKAGKP